MASLKLTKGYTTTVDDEDYEWLQHYSWCVAMSYGKPYAINAAGKLHHFLAGYPLGTYEVDHIDGNALNNKRDNLRIVSHAENQQNRGKQRNNTSGYKGVYLHKCGRWAARVTRNGRTYSCGYHDTPEEAHTAANEARAYFGMPLA